MLPVRELEPIGGGPPVRIGSNRPRALVLVVTHAGPCDDCRGYLESFRTVAPSYKAEKSDVVALVGPEWDPASWASWAAGAVPDERLRDALAGPGHPAVAVVDRFGQLFRRVDAGAGHAFPDHAGVLQTLIDIGIRCPECGVPDVPSPDLLPEEGTRSGGMLLGQ